MDFEKKTQEENGNSKMGESMPERADFQVVAELFHQLGDPTRIRIYWILCHREACVMEIAEQVEMSSPAVAHHLKLLKNNGLLESRKSGKEVFYRAETTPVAQALHEMIEDMMEISCPGGSAHEH